MLFRSLEKHPAVAQSAVVSVPHKVKGEAPVAFVVLASENAASEDDLRRFALENGPAYAHPRMVFFIDALPLASTNKIDRKSLESKARILAAELSGNKPLN